MNHSMEKIIEDLIKLFPAGQFDEEGLLDFAKKNGLDEQDISEIKEMFALIDRTSEKEKELQDHRANGGTLKSFISKELKQISEKNALSENEHNILVEAYQKATELAQNRIIEED